MKITRKLQRMVENKIRHAMASGQLPVIQRSQSAKSEAKPDPGRAGSTQPDASP